MSTDDQAPEDREPGWRAVGPPKHRVLRGAAVIGAVVCLILGIVVVAAYQHLDGNISRVDITEQLTDRPTKEVTATQEEPREPLNILVIGSDTREGKGNGIDRENPGQRSDTTILLHLSADRSFAYGVSLPRDAMVQRPDCLTPEGEVIPGGFDMFNAAYSLGDTACTVQQVEQLTGVRVDHYVVVDFRGFKDMVDALGGVTICVPKDVNDTEGKIQLDAGTYTADGQTALDYVRVRKDISDNGDIGRMKRQQLFLATMVNEAMSVGTLTNPKRLYGFLDAATQSVEMDPELGSLRELAGLARQFRSIGLENIQFLSVPFEQWEVDRNRLVWKPEARRLWRLMIEDQPLTPRFAGEIVTAGDELPSSPGPSDNPSDEPSASASAEPTQQPSPEESRRAEIAAENGLCV